MALTKMEVYLRSSIRKVWRWTSQERKAILKAGKCIECGKTGLKKGEINADHISPVVDPEIGFVDWNTYIKRMWGTLQGLCIKCHKGKSRLETKERTKTRKAKKDGRK